MRFGLYIETSDRHLAFHIMETKTLGREAVLSAPGGADVHLTGIEVKKAVDIPEVLHFVVDAATNIDLGLFCAWLYDKVKDKPIKRIAVNKRVVTVVSADGLYQAISEEVKRE